MQTTGEDGMGVCLRDVRRLVGTGQERERKRMSGGERELSKSIFECQHSIMCVSTDLGCKLI